MGTTMRKPARVVDKEVMNWFECALALKIMKEAIHDYIDNEVKKLHADITQKVSNNPSWIHCGSCSWKSIKRTGGKLKNWHINCPSGICDKWLQQILAVHDDPHNPTINWKNADISKWPTDYYQVAKIFMPKGKHKTIKMPDDLDAPAILSLMKYCNWFRKDLPKTQILDDLIDIRNKVQHSGDMKVADSDKIIWIDQMIQLLNDLKIPGGAQDELQKKKISVEHGMLDRHNVLVFTAGGVVGCVVTGASGILVYYTYIKRKEMFYQNGKFNRAGTNIPSYTSLPSTDGVCLILNTTHSHLNETFCQNGTFNRTGTNLPSCTNLPSTSSLNFLCPSMEWIIDLSSEGGKVYCESINIYGTKWRLPKHNHAYSICTGARLQLDSMTLPVLTCAPMQNVSESLFSGSLLASNFRRSHVLTCAPMQNVSESLFSGSLLASNFRRSHVLTCAPMQNVSELLFSGSLLASNFRSCRLPDLICGAMQNVSMCGAGGMDSTCGSMCIIV